MTASKQSFSYTPEFEKQAVAVTAKYEKKRSALLPLLWLVQEQHGHVTPEAAQMIADRLEMTAAEVWEAVTFYVMFRRKDLGKYCLQVCSNVTCTMMGSEKIVKVIEEELGLKPNEVTKDGMFSYVPVQCLGSCDTAPVVQVNLDYCEKVDPDVFRRLIQKLKAGQYPTEMFESQGVAE